MERPKSIQERNVKDGAMHLHSVPGFQDDLTDLPGYAIVLGMTVGRFFVHLVCLAYILAKYQYKKMPFLVLLTNVVLCTVLDVPIILNRAFEKRERVSTECSSSSGGKSFLFAA